MYQSFAECLHALLSDDRLNEVRGGSIIKLPNGFTYRLYGQPDDEEGELYFELAPSLDEGEDWKALPVSLEAQAAWDAFKTDPLNGDLLFVRNRPR